MGDPTADLGDLWRWFARHQFHGDSPIYERIALAVADDREILDLLRQAPPAAHLPLAPLAAACSLLLDGLDHPLGDVYDGRSDADPARLFIDLCRRHRTELMALLETRRVQTNDCGRSAIIGPALIWVAQRRPGPYCLVDVGASAGLNLLCDAYRLDYGPHGTTGPTDSSVRIACEVRGGDPPVADHLPDLEERIGIDLAPIDVTDPADARWLLACVWPDSGRAERVEASIRLALERPPALIEGRRQRRAAVGPRRTGRRRDGDRHDHVGVRLLLDRRPPPVPRPPARRVRRRHVVWLSAENIGVVEALDHDTMTGRRATTCLALSSSTTDRSQLSCLPTSTHTATGSAGEPQFEHDWPAHTSGVRSA